MFKVGDTVEWVSNEYPKYMGKRATVTKLEVDDMVYIHWGHIHINGYGEQGPWFGIRFKLAASTPFEQSVLDYIKAELHV